VLLGTGGVKLRRFYLFAIAAIFMVSIFGAQAFAASSPWIKKIPLGGEKYLFVRGVDRPHSFQNFKSWPGYDSFVHSNCYHVHGEYKKISSNTGREYSSSKVSIPLYCKGLTKYIGKAFKGAAGELGLSTWKFLKVGGVLVTLIMEIPTVGGGGTTVCNQNATTNSTSCYWVEY